MHKYLWYRVAPKNIATFTEADRTLFKIETFDIQFTDFCFRFLEIQRSLLFQISCNCIDVSLVSVFGKSVRLDVSRPEFDSLVEKLEFTTSIAVEDQMFLGMQDIDFTQIQSNFPNLPKFRFILLKFRFFAEISLQYKFRSNLIKLAQI